MFCMHGHLSFQLYSSVWIWLQAYGFGIDMFRPAKCATRRAQPPRRVIPDLPSNQSQRNRINCDVMLGTPGSSAPKGRTGSTGKAGKTKQASLLSFFGTPKPGAGSSEKQQSSAGTGRMRLDDDHMTRRANPRVAQPLRNASADPICCRLLCLFCPCQGWRKCCGSIGEPSRGHSRR
jgi:hypothetical protein